MVIKIFLGNVGSGKTVCCVKEMYTSQHHRVTYTNIKTKIKNMRLINPDMIVTENEDGKKVLNVEYWKKEVLNHPNGLNVIIDEAHSILNARRAMHKANQIITDWLSLIRRVLGSDPSQSGDLILISQLARRLDPIARDMCTHVRYHVCYYRKQCKKCNAAWPENSDMPEPAQQCKVCGSWYLFMHSHRVLVYFFENMYMFEFWQEMKGQSKTYYKRKMITDIEKYFKMYDTLQWDNLFSKLYA